MQNQPQNDFGQGLHQSIRDRFSYAHPLVSIPNPASHEVNQIFQWVAHREELEARPSSQEPADPLARLAWDVVHATEVHPSTSVPLARLMLEHVVHEVTEHLNTLDPEGFTEPAQVWLPSRVQHFTAIPSNDLSDDDNCPICYLAYNNGDHVAVRMQNVECDHVFGRDCLTAAVNTGTNSAHNCPICRRSIVGALVHDIAQSHRNRIDSWRAAIAQILMREEEIQSEASNAQPGGNSVEDV